MTDEEMLDRLAFAGTVVGPLLMEAPDSERSRPIIEQLGMLESFEGWPFGTDEELAYAFGLVSAGLGDENRATLKREFTRLFIGSSRFQAPPWGSVYLDHECVVFGDSTFELARWLRSHGVEVLYTEKEPVDQIGRMLLLLAYLAEERPELVDEYLNVHLLPWAPRFFDLFVEDAGHPFYEGVGRLGRAMVRTLLERQGASVRPRKLFF